MKKVLSIILALVLVGGAVYGTYFWQQQKINDLNKQVTALTKTVEELKNVAGVEKPIETTSYTSEKGVVVSVTNPTKNATVSSPLTVNGSVPGSWSFEAQFSVRLIDAQGNLLDEAPATLNGDWMTDRAVPFSAELTFGTGASTNGTLVLIKANPSDLAANNDSVVIPVKF